MLTACALISCSFQWGKMFIVLSRRMLSARAFLIHRLLLWLPISLVGHAAAAADASFGPLFQQFKLTLDSGRRSEYVGPLYYEQEIGEGEATRLWAAPPLFSYSLSPDLDYELFEFLWKGISYDRF